MITIVSFVSLVAFMAIANMGFAWSRRADAKHRERFRSMGYTENFPSYRHRVDKRKRLLVVFYGLLAGGLMLLTPTLPIARFNEGFLIIANALVEVLAWIPAVILYLLVAGYQEATNPEGMRPVKMRAKQFYAQPLEIQPNGEYGPMKMLSPGEIGLINLQGLQTSGFRPIVPDEVQK